MPPDAPSEVNHAKPLTNGELVAAYAEAVRDVARKQKASNEAAAAYQCAVQARQDAWRAIAIRRNERTLPKGVYRVARRGPHEEGVLVGDGDYPELFPMYEGLVR